MIKTMKLRLRNLDGDYADDSDTDKYTLPSRNTTA